MTRWRTPWDTNMMTGKGFNLFDEYAARCAHLSPQEEECTCFSWGDIKMYTSGSTANSQRMLTEINKNGCTAKIRIWVESAFKRLKAFRIISSKLLISLLIPSWWYFSCLHIQRLLLTYFHKSLKYFFKSLWPSYTDQLFWKVIAYEQ